MQASILDELDFLSSLEDMEHTTSRLCAYPYTLAAGFLFVRFYFPAKLVQYPPPMSLHLLLQEHGPRKSGSHNLCHYFSGVTLYKFIDTLHNPFSILEKDSVPLGVNLGRSVWWVSIFLAYLKRYGWLALRYSELW